MIESKKIVVLIGSPKRRKSTSYSLAKFLVDQLPSINFVSEILFINNSIKDEKKTNILFEQIRKADIIVLSFPLYVDSLPSRVIQFMEICNERRNIRKNDKKQKFMAIVNCGFPESFHNKTALNICKSFAEESDFQWIGGLSLGAGGAVAGKSISEKSGMLRNPIKAIRLVAEALINNKEIPGEAFTLMEKDLMPQNFYTFIGNFGWYLQAIANKQFRKLKNRPFDKSE